MVAALAVLLVGWFTGVRMVMHSVLIGLFVTAFLPFVIAVALLLLLIALTIVGMIAADNAGAEVAVHLGSGLVEEGISVGVEHTVPRYYQFLGRIRHPAIWGIVVGMLAGGLSLWGVVSWLIVPRELATSQILVEVVTRLMDSHRETGKFPTPTTEGYLDARDIGRPVDGPVRDAFGRPLRFATSGRSVFASFTVRSVGFDGRDGTDDLCASGAAKGAELAGRLGNLLSHIRLGKEGRPLKFSERLQALSALRCEEP